MVFNDEQVKRALTESIKKHIRETVRNNATKLEILVKKRFGVKVRTSSEYRSLVSEQGRLRLDFGIEEPIEVMRGIIDTLLENVVVKVNRGSNDGAAYILPLSITLFDDKSLSAVLGAYGASYTSDDNSNWSGMRVEWLKWLLLSGGEPVVIGYRVEYGDYSGRNHFGEIRSRTEHAIMVKNDNDSFEVDTRFQGSRENNFITRAANSMEDEIGQLVQKTIMGQL